MISSLAFLFSVKMYNDNGLSFLLMKLIASCNIFYLKVILNNFNHITLMALYTFFTHLFLKEVK